MTSKQLGKLRQWAGEVISSWDKTTVSEEFRELERDIELRKDGAAKLLAASEVYQHAISKKKKVDTLEDLEKILPLDALGIVMVMHGDEFGDDSAYGSSLVKFGNAHRKVAELQERYAGNLKETFLTSLGRFLDEIKEYESQRKKLDSRRLSYDAALSKFEKQKNSKKDKEKREAEEELDKARQRYEETSGDVQSQIHAIQENEIDQLRQLTDFFDSELLFVEEYYRILKGLKGDWYDESSIVQVAPKRASSLPHIFSKHQESSDSDAERTPRDLRRKSGSVSSRQSSRSMPHASRKRSDSGATIGDKDEKERAPRRMSVAGWASNAMGSVTGRGKKNKDKDTFAALEGDDTTMSEQETDEDGLRASSKKSSGTFQTLSRKLSKSKEAQSPSAKSKILKPPSQRGNKVVHVVQDFSGGVNELTLKTGDEIVVVNEVLDDWWMGELNGKKGLFPASHVEPAASSMLLSQRRRRGSALLPILSPNNDVARQHPSDGGLGHEDSDSYFSSDLDDHDLGRVPLSAHHASPFFGGLPDTASITSSTGGEDDKLFPPFMRDIKSFNENSDEPRTSATMKAPPVLPVRTLTPSPVPPAAPPIPRRAMPPEASGKKAPPPPPPRRPTPSVVGPTPPVPERLYKYHLSGKPGNHTPPSSVSSHGNDRSPFESEIELSTPGTVDL